MDSQHKPEAVATNADSAPLYKDLANYFWKNNVTVIYSSGMTYNTDMINSVSVSIATQPSRAQRIHDLMSFLAGLNDQEFERAYEAMDEATWDWQFANTPDAALAAMRQAVDEAVASGKTRKLP